MEKELVTIEFRYTDKPNTEHDSGDRSKTVTIGIYDTLEEAIIEGNKTLGILAKTFEVRHDDKFGLHNSSFGTPKRLVTNTSYPTKNIQYFAQIIKLNICPIEFMINETFVARKRYEESKNKE